MEERYSLVNAYPVAVKGIGNTIKSSMYFAERGKEIAVCEEFAPLLAHAEKIKHTGAKLQIRNTRGDLIVTFND